MNSSATGTAPRFLTPTSTADRARGDGPFACDWIDTLCRITKDSYAGRAGTSIRLRGWQRDLICGLLARREDGHRQFRQALVGVPRKNTKSTIGSAVALEQLVEGPQGGEVYSCAGDKDQARIVFGTAKRMVELEPDLSQIVKCYRDALEVPATGSVYRCLSAEAFTKEGLNPSLVVFDELHVQPTDELWNVMTLATGARTDPLVLAISTAGVTSDQTGGDSICYRLYQHGKRVVSGEVDDPSFFFAWWEPGPDADHRDPVTWRDANPGFGDLCDPEDFASAVVKTPEAEFRRKRCNQWTAGAVAWLPTGAFEGRADRGRVVPAGTPVVLGFDGSYSGDSTGLVGCTLDGFVFVVDAWERPGDLSGWTVDIAQVEQAVRDACAKWKVLEVAADPYRWARSMQALQDEGFPVVEFPCSSPSRMVPACQTFYDAVMAVGGSSVLSHDGDERLERHVRQAVVKRDRLGARIVKDARESPRKIDLAVCAVIAYERSVFYRDAAPKSRPIYSY